MKKTCTVCKKEKSLDDFTRHIIGKDGISAHCRECNKEMCAKWRNENSEHIKEYKKKYNKENHELIKSYRKKPLNNFRGNLAQNIRRSFQIMNIPKNSKTAKIVGCSFKKLYNHCCRQFKKIYGIDFDPKIHKVHIDHIIPIVTAKTVEDIIRLNHYKNLRLILAEDNLRKHSKLEFNDFTKLENKDEE